MKDRHLLALGGITAAASLSLISSSSLGAINSFTTRAAFNAAVGSAQLAENFSGFLADIDFRTAPVPANGFILSQEGTNPTNFRNLVDVPPLGQVDNNGTANASSYTNFPEAGAPGTQVRITFPIAARGFGADFYNTTLLEGLVMDVFSGTSTIASFTIPLVANTGVFFGVAGNAGESITSVLLRSATLSVGTGGEGYGMDDGAVALIPEPATASLMAAFGSLPLARRGRRGA